MAKATFKMPDEFLMKLSRLGEMTDEICEKVLEAGAAVVESKVRSNLRSAVGKGTKHKSHRTLRSQSTGELLRSLGTSSVRQDKNGSPNIKISFSEPRSDGADTMSASIRQKRGNDAAQTSERLIANAKIAAILEYGKSGQLGGSFCPPKPFMKSVQNASKQAAINAMKSAFESEIGKI